MKIFWIKLLSTIMFLIGLIGYMIFFKGNEYGIVAKIIGLVLSLFIGTPSLLWWYKYFKKIFGVRYSVSINVDTSNFDEAIKKINEALKSIEYEK